LYIKHLEVSANFKVVAFIEICSGLTGKFFEIPNVSYTQPLEHIQLKLTCVATCYALPPHKLNVL